MLLKDLLIESINDKGIFKAIFIIGLPGAGKSYTSAKLVGTVNPRVVNTDRAGEFLSKKYKIRINKDSWPELKDTALRITKSSLTQYINGMLPLFVDGTSNDASNLLHRMGILESLGYDVGIIHVKTSLEVALKRAKARAEEINREVDPEFIRQVHSRTDDNVEFLKTKVSFFEELNNTGDMYDNELLQKAFKKTQKFFLEPVHNPIGKRFLKQLEEAKEKYLSPSIIPLEVLDKKIDGWYK